MREVDFTKHFRNTIAECRTELWRLLEHVGDNSSRPQELQTKANNAILKHHNVHSVEELNCQMCRNPLTEDTVAKCEVGIIRLDSSDMPWCETCTDKHDAIDPDEGN